MMKVFTRQFQQLPKNTASAAKWPLMIFALLLSATVSWGQVSITATGSYTQDFNTLLTTGSATWTDNSTVASWYAQRSGSGATIVAGDGGSTTGALYSFGTGTNSDRALGSQGSGTVGNLAWGVQLQNNSSSTVTDIKVTYTMEQWRKSGVTVAQGLSFFYKISSSSITALNPNVNGTWTAVSSLNTNSPINTATAAALVGNNTANKVTVTNVAIPSLSLAPGEFIMLKWDDPDHSGADHALSIDDVTINWTVPAATPPVVTPDNIFTSVGATVNYQVQATNSPTSYGLVGALPAGLSFSSLTGIISGTPTASETQTVSVTATNGGGTSDPADITIQVDPGNQTITFDPLADVTYGDADFSLSATASSGLPITYFSSNPFVAQISGNTVTIVGAGSTTITATQEGDANYNAAPDVPQTLTVNKAAQTVTFGPLADKSTADADFALTATASSGLPVSYSSSDLGVATIIAPNTLHIVGAGNTTITASQAGDDNYLPATSVDQNQFISNASLQNQTITFPAIPNAVYGDAPVALNATASSGLTVTYSSDDPNVATVSGSSLVVTGVGTANITASQAGNGTYNPAPDEIQTFTVTTKELTVSGVVANDKNYDGSAAATLDLTGAALVGVVGADDVSFSTTGASFVSADAGTGISVNANLTLSGADAYKYTLAQPAVTADIFPATQVITFNPLPAANTNTAPIDLNTYASVNSPLALSYFSSDDNVASVSGNILTINGPGTALITATQSGDANYAAATPVDQSITVTLAPSVVTWNFGTMAAAPFPSAGLPVNHLDVSAIQQGNNANSSQTSNQITTVSSSASAGFSGDYNIGTTADDGPFNPMVSAYFEFTLTPDAGYTITLNDLNTASRSTGTGPEMLAVRTSADGFVNNIATSDPSNNSTYTLRDFSFAPVTSGTPLTVRIYGYDGVGNVTSTSANNWRLDDLTIEVLVEAQAQCTGTPEAGSISAVNDEFCGSGITDITATGFTDPGSNPGVSLQWFSSTNNVDFAPVDGATSATLVTGVLSQTTYYYLQVSCSGSGLSDVTNTVTIAVNEIPATPSISGSNTVCTGNTTTLTSTAAPAGGTYAWYNNGNLMVETTQSVNVGAGVYTVMITSAEGCASDISASFEVSELGSPSAPFVQGPSNVCNFVGTGDPVEFTVFPDPTVTSYTWTVPAYTTIVGGQGTGTLTVTFQNGFIAAPGKQIRVTGTSACGTTPMTIKYLHAQIPTTPSAITGPTNVCDLIGTATTATYSVPLVESATDYDWVLPAGVTLVNDNGNSIDVSFTNAFVNSNISVRASNTCGVSNARSIAVKRIAPPLLALISGPTNVCLYMPTASNPAGVEAVYSVALAANVTTYNWTVPTGATITDQTTTATHSVITVAYSGAFAGGSISVSASNNCGTSAPRTLALSQLNPSTPSPIDVVNTQSCPNRVVTYSLSGMPANTTDLVWTVPVGGTILSGQGTASIQVEYAGTPIEGTVSVTASNGCATSGTRSVAVKLAGCPPAPKQEKKPMVTTPAISGVEVEVLDANIFPNPSVSDFRLKVKSSAKGNIQVRIFDANGVAHTKMIVTPGETISFGNHLKAGTYFVEVMQGGERKVSKIVKL